MIWLIAATFAIPLLLNSKDAAKYFTSLSFLIIYILNAGNTFEGENLIYCNMLLSASLLIAPSLTSGRDWASILFIIVGLFICSDFLAIINFHNMQSQAIATGIDTFKYLATTMVLAVLVIMSNGKLDRYTISDKIKQLEHSCRSIFHRSNSRARLQEG